MEKQNDVNFKKGQKANEYRYAHEDELFSVCIGTHTFTAYLEKIVKYAKLDYLHHQQLITENEEPTDDLSKIVEQGALGPLDDDFLVKTIKASTLEQIVSDERLYKAILKLSSIEKKVLYYLYVEEMTTKEVADLISISQRWIQKNRKKALYKLYCALECEEEY
jgi:RNA polymerase sigma factor (sigma-70 family)